MSGICSHTTVRYITTRTFIRELKTMHMLYWIQLITLALYLHLIALMVCMPLRYMTGLRNSYTYAWTNSDKNHYTIPSKQFGMVMSSLRMESLTTDIRKYLLSPAHHQPYYTLSPNGQLIQKLYKHTGNLAQPWVAHPYGRALIVWRVATLLPTMLSQDG